MEVVLKSQAVNPKSNQPYRPLHSRAGAITSEVCRERESSSLLSDLRSFDLRSIPRSLPLNSPAANNGNREIHAFEAADRANPPPQDAILFVGSSTIRMWTTLAQDFPEHKVINRGFGGCQIADCTYYADRIVIPYKPRLIVLRAGGNDIHAGKTPEQVQADFQAFVEKVRAKLPEVRIAYMTINATPARWANVEQEKKANQLIKDYIAKGENLDYIDTFDATMGADGKPRKELFIKDRLHFNAEGYKILAAQVRDHLAKRTKGLTPSAKTQRKRMEQKQSQNNFAKLLAFA